MDIFQSQRFRSSLKGLGDTTSRLARVMRTDARMRKNDYAEISRLNDRLTRTIPIIPAAFGISGATLGRGVDDGGFPGFFGFPGFPGFGFPGGPRGPQGPRDPRGPSRPPATPPVLTKEELEETTVVDEGGVVVGSEEYNRQKAEEKKRKEEQEKIKEGVKVREPVQPGQTPAEREQEAQPERKKPTTEPTTPPFVPVPPAVPKKPKPLYATLPPFFIPDVLTQKGQVANRPVVTIDSIPNFDPNNSSHKKELNQQIFTYIFNNPKSRFARQLESGVLLKDGTMIIRRPGQQIRYSEPLTEEQLALIRIMGIANISDWLPIIPIRGVPRRGTTSGRSPITTRGRGTRGRDPIEKARQRLEEIYNQPSGIPGPPEPAAQPTQPALPGASINQTTLPPSATQPLTKTVRRSASKQTIDVQPLTKSVQRGNVEVGGSQGAANPIPKSYRSSFTQQDVPVLRERLLKIYEDRRNRLLKDPTSDELNIIKALQQLGVEVPKFKPAIGPQASAKVRIKPIYILTDQIA